MAASDRLDPGHPGLVARLAGRGISVTGVIEAALGSPRGTAVVGAGSDHLVLDTGAEHLP